MNDVVGVGCDLCSIKRFNSLILSYSIEDLGYLFSQQEILHYEKWEDPKKGYAIAFAGKEAVGKCLGIGLGGISWNDIEVFAGKRNLKIYVHRDAKKAARKLNVSEVCGVWNLYNEDFIVTYAIGAK